MFPFDLNIVFEDTQPLAGASFPMTFRADVEVTGPEQGDWRLNGIDLPTGNINEWRPIRNTGRWPEPVIRGLCHDVITSKLGYEIIETAIATQIAHLRQYAEAA